MRGDTIGIGRGDGDGDCIRTLANANKVYADAVPAEEKRASRTSGTRTFPFPNPALVACPQRPD